MASMYSAKVMEHFANPHNVGEIPDANGVGEVGNPKCGDIMRMYLKIENNVIVDVKFLTFGCEMCIRDRHIAEHEQDKNQEIAALVLGVRALFSGQKQDGDAGDAERDQDVYKRQQRCQAGDLCGGR